MPSWLSVMTSVVPTHSGRTTDAVTSQITAEGQVACLTRSSSGSSMPSKVIRSSPPSVADPVAGAHHAPNSAAVVRISNTRSGDTFRWTWFS